VNEVSNRLDEVQAELEGSTKSATTMQSELEKLKVINIGFCMSIKLMQPIDQTNRDFASFAASTEVSGKGDIAAYPPFADKGRVYTKNPRSRRSSGRGIQ